MAENDKTLDALEKSLEDLVRTQVDFQKEIIRIRQEIAMLRGEGSRPAPPATQEKRPESPPPVQPPPPPRAAGEQPPPPPKTSTDLPPKWPVASPPEAQRPPTQDPPQRPPVSPPPPPRQQTGQYQPPPPPPRETQAPNFGYRSEQARAPRFKDKSELEKFIGENLISKIGIVVLIIGVGIGAKYAIDRGWITPLMRIIFGYAIGFGLLGLAVKLKPKYHNFSAVLLSGGMAIMYFITYFAYSLYELIPQSAAFALMVMFTAFTVASAIIYSRQVIAHIGLVGAYAVPFLLSNNSGNYPFLFTYMALVNLGVLAVSVKKYWKPLSYTAFIFTWATFGGWFASKYRGDDHFFLALLFLGIFFATFYLLTIVQHRLFEERTGVADLILTIFNTLIFYGFCFSMIDRTDIYGRYLTLFAYIGAFTLGILIVSIRDYRRPLFLISFACTWLTFLVWYIMKYSQYDHFYLGTSAAAAFFLIFYVTGLVHSRVFPEKAAVENVAPILTNSFIFFGTGYSILDGRPEFSQYMGLYTMAHAGFHFIFAAVTSRLKSFPIEVTYLLAALMLTFITIAVPVQFEGNVVTLIWAAEGAILFAIGRMKQIRLYEYFSYPLTALATLALIADWSLIYGYRDEMNLDNNAYPLANGAFVGALVYIVSLAVIYLINRDERFEAPGDNGEVRRLIKYVSGAAAMLALYNTFRMEIGNYFHYRKVSTSIKSDFYARSDHDLGRLNIVWQINYTMVFLSILGLVNIRRLKGMVLAAVNILTGALTTVIFCTAGLLLLGELRESYMLQSEADLFYRGGFHIVARYISLLCAGGLFFLLYRYTKQEFLQSIIPANTLTLGFDALFYPLLLITASSELINCMDLAGYNDSYKFGLSVLWGIYALFLVGAGIYFKKKHLRIGAIVLFAITLAKLFLYDISQLGTIAKTVVFVSVGILMLIVSFLYTKYKSVIFGNDENLPG